MFNEMRSDQSSGELPDDTESLYMARKYPVYSTEQQHILGGDLHNVIGNTQ